MSQETPPETEDAAILDEGSRRRSDGMRSYEVRLAGGRARWVWAVTENTRSVALVAPVVLGAEDQLPLLIEIRPVGGRYFDTFRVWRDGRGALRVDNFGEARSRGAVLPGLR